MYALQDYWHWHSRGSNDATIRNIDLFLCVVGPGAKQVSEEINPEYVLWIWCIFDEILAKRVHARVALLMLVHVIICLCCAFIPFRLESQADLPLLLWFTMMLPGWTQCRFGTRAEQPKPQMFSASVSWCVKCAPRLRHLRRRVKILLPTLTFQSLHLEHQYLSKSWL